jgi:cytochrome c oxidase subunit 2
MNFGAPFGPQSHQALAISRLFATTMVISAVILAGVTALVLYAAWRYGTQGNTPGGGEPRQHFGRPRLEIAWTVAPTILLLVLFVFTVRTMRAADPPIPSRAPDIVIIAHQWWWEVRYPGSGAVTANEIHVPIATPLVVAFQSADVIHDFWVPALGRKMDIIPGRSNSLWIEADAAGTYLGACAEFCGAQHAWMRIRVVAQTPDQFATWRDGQLRPAAVAAAGDVERGAQLFQQVTCANCHTIAGTAALGRIGPDLTHLMSRTTLAAGVLENTPESLTRWLANPGTVKPGSHMPSLQLTPKQVHLLVAYLETLP